MFIYKHIVHIIDEKTSYNIEQESAKWFYNKYLFMRSGNKLKRVQTIKLLRTKANPINISSQFVPSCTTAKTHRKRK